MVAGFVGGAGLCRAAKRTSTSKCGTVVPSMVSVSGPQTKTRVQTINSDGFKEAVSAADIHKNVIVVKIGASYCKSCKNMEPRFKKLANAYSDFNYYEIDYEQNKELCEDLGVTTLPHFHVYDPKTQHSEDLSCAWTEAGKLRDVLDKFSA
mmetsp:Transcript_3489/g.10556  ORF Transcript_3489/g.10556 Transcript_3489/m.10556 type:complete len:151 (-) Transcript_3489:113-565(-)|eukprot:CAMPEP_0198728610 /NCGR_PEP_ID=MMETSP1475-20131203/10300_1 /TAXON_ID= ORGANISM="Unidentified sp., Strain CCMP1999" /NCGR_SAMPLE_ID=MMETSP1475 /ASSEMBLY_ACC=CAM_ASM_001111 /LENGTH=150 /DNA_ID=CAMNT_0044491023 /DNA_START=97 /DNA_END=549 /DNA_ORIENTATION=+